MGEGTAAGREKTAIEVAIAMAGIAMLHHPVDGTAAVAQEVLEGTDEIMVCLNSILPHVQNSTNHTERRDYARDRDDGRRDRDRDYRDDRRRDDKDRDRRVYDRDDRREPGKRDGDRDRDTKSSDRTQVREERPQDKRATTTEIERDGSSRLGRFLAVFDIISRNRDLLTTHRFIQILYLHHVRSQRCQKKVKKTRQWMPLMKMMLP